jgi:hypothetical protein
VTLGISTLLTYVPVSLGAAHQAGALTLFTVVLGLLHSLRRPHMQTPAIARVRTRRHADCSEACGALSITIVFQSPLRCLRSGRIC